jgi:hypothetical protein
MVTKAFYLSLDEKRVILQGKIRKGKCIKQARKKEKSKKIKGKMMSTLTEAKSMI